MFSLIEGAAGWHCEVAVSNSSARGPNVRLTVLREARTSRIASVVDG